MPKKNSPTTTPQNPGITPDGLAKKALRQDREGRALRENLKRRKLQLQNRKQAAKTS